MAYTVFAQYCIMFRNRDDYEFAIAANGGSYELDMPPRTAAGIFGVPFPYPTGPIDDVPVYIFFPGGFNPGEEIMHPGPTGIFFDDTVAEVFVPGQTVTTGAGPLLYPDMIVRWAGALLRAGGVVNEDDPTTIPRRRWIGGVELAPMLEAGSFAETVGCREASRTPDGFGFAIRGSNTGGSLWTRLLDELVPGISTTQSWERFYFRPRVPGTSDAGLWRCRNSTSSNSGAGIKYATNGDILVYNINSIGVETLLTTIPAPDAMVWIKVDILLCYPTGAPGSNGGLFIYFNGVNKYAQSFPPGDGMGLVGNHERSTIGRWTITVDNLVQYDVDDWINADWPSKTGVQHQADLDGVDWINGSHVKRRWVESGTITNWTPNNPQLMNQGTNPTLATDIFSSSTSGAAMEGLTDVKPLDIDSLIEDFTGVSIGPVAAVVGIESANAGASNGQLGYKVAGGAAVMASIDQQVALGYNAVLYRPNGLIVPVDISPFSIRHTKSADGNGSTVHALSLVTEEIGAWGTEDIPEIPELPRNFLHNCRFPNTPWAMPVGPWDGPVYAVGGTYVGNDLFNDVIIPLPCHMLWIRALSGGNGGVKWFACSIGGHLGSVDRVIPDYVLRVWMDSITGDFKFRVTGTDSQVNANGVTYQYVAFCDPGARFNYCGAYNRPSLLAADSIELADSNFLAEAAFVQGEQLQNASTNQQLTYRGPGSPANSGNTMVASTITNWGNFSQGLLNTLIDIHYNTLSQVNFSLWRTVLQADCGLVGPQIGQFTGDGTGPRTVAVTPAAGLFPLLAIVIPTSGAQQAVFRDPSHVGADSSRVDTLASVVNGIIGGGIDSIQVGANLNALGVVYNYFILPGDYLGWNNGNFSYGSCMPPGDEWVPPNDEPPNVAIQGDGGLGLNGQVPLTVLKDVSGIYTIVEGQKHDTLYDRLTGQPSINVKIPNPTAKTGYIGG